MGDVPAIRPALVLTAGLGTRLDPLTRVRAKPAVPVAGEPLVRRIARWLAASGVTELILNLHHLPQTISAVMGDGSDLGLRVRFSWEQPIVLGSAGGPRQALDIIGAESFFIVNGDTLTDVDLAALAAAHTAAAPPHGETLVTLALVPNTEPHRYSGLTIDADGRVTGRVARGRAAEGSYHFVGVQVAEAAAFRDVQKGVAVNSIGDHYDALSRRTPGAVRGFVTEAAFFDIGTVGDYVRTHWSLAAGPAATDAARSHTICWDDVHIGPHATLTRCIVTDGVTVPDGTTYTDAILIASPEGVVALPLDAS